MGKISLVVATVTLIVAANEAQSQYKYNYKLGEDQYNYDVNGYGDEGSYYGNVDTNGKNIEGYVTNEDGEESYFQGEFTSYGTMEGYDEEGNYIELEVD